MSKIQIAALNRNASEFNALNDQETAEVVGGYGGYYSEYYSSKLAAVQQANFNETNQAALGGGYYDGASNYNSTYQNNFVSISQ
ncbi:MAG: hypothetical protein QNJ53_23515 [Pleurocapsa sp. MO_192.B19]|nr:hypothetical protein [Pleurocapsa sp. MO_192.B19]